jgi:hypothetical protein
MGHIMLYGVSQPIGFISINNRISAKLHIVIEKRGEVKLKALQIKKS